MAYQPDLQIAAGHNGAGSLQAFEAVVTVRGGNDYGIQSWGNYTDGIVKFRSDGTTYISGFPSTQWVISIIDYDAYWTIRNTYCSGGVSGLVTIKTNTTRHGTYANYNATMVIQQPADFQLADSRAFVVDFVIRFIHMEAL